MILADLAAWLKGGVRRRKVAKFRIYIDETGNHDMTSCERPEHRFLGLTGVIFELETVRMVLVPRLEGIKAQFFPYDPDSPPILHRKELIHKKYPFTSLRDPATETAFNAVLSSFIEELPFSVVSVVIDKLEHRNRYTVWRAHPYHYCLSVLLERYVHFLEGKGGHGDVLAESRGRQADMQLKTSFASLYKRGTDYIAGSRFRERLTS